MQMGLSNAEVQVYFYLSKKGPCTEKELMGALKLNKHQLHCSLKKLKTKSMVDCTTEPASLFTAISLEIILDQCIKTSKEEARALKANKKELLSNWHL